MTIKGIFIAIGLLSLYFTFAHGNAFTPTLSNLNTISLLPASSTAATKPLSIDELVACVNKQQTPINGFIDRKDISQYTRFEKGIHKAIPATPIFIFSRFIARGDSPRSKKWWGSRHHPINGAGVWATYQWMKNGILHAPSVAYDFPYSKTTFDFGQEVHRSSLELVYNETITKNPESPIVLAGTCLGAKAILELCCYEKKPNLAPVKALILESPWLSLKDLCYNFSRWVPGMELIPYGYEMTYRLLKSYFPQYNQANDNLLDRIITHGPQDIPMFIAHLKSDKMIEDACMFNFVRTLLLRGNKNIYLLVIEDKKQIHGHLNDKPTFIAATNAFLAKNNLPHDPILAAKGTAYLQQAKQNAFAPAYGNWVVIKDPL